MWAFCWCVKPGVDSHPLIVDLKIICFILQALCTRLTMKISGSRQGLLQQKQCWNFMHPSCAFHDKFPGNCFMLQYCFLESDDLLCHGVMLFFLFEKGVDSKNIGVHFKRVFFFHSYHTRFYWQYPGCAGQIGRASLWGRNSTAIVCILPYFSWVFLLKIAVFVFFCAIGCPLIHHAGWRTANNITGEVLASFEPGCFHTSPIADKRKVTTTRKMSWKDVINPFNFANLYGILQS